MRWAASELAHQAGRSRTLTIDIGGTSCDLALGIDGKVGTNRRYEVGGLPVRLPALDVHTIGAGGVPSLGSTQAARCESDRNRQEPSPALPATGAVAETRRSPTPTCFLGVCLSD